MVFLFTLVWALWESGLDYWRLMPRLGVMMALAIVMALLLPWAGGRKKFAWPLAGVLALVFVGGIAAAFVPHNVIRPQAAIADAAPLADGAAADWRHYGRTPAGTRYSPASQITPANVDELQVAWTFRTGDITTGAADDQTTPLQVGDSLYVCTPHNKVFSLDPDSGEKRWEFDPKASNGVWEKCRGLGYWEAATDGAPAAACGQRIYVATIDSRLIALDAATGRACADFGAGGTVDLSQGMLGQGKMSWVTSAPTVAGNLVIVGGWAFDQAVEVPSGVLRAYDVVSGELVWTWDPGNPATTRLPPEGESYSIGGPNMWSTPAYDAQLGLLYIPTGMGGPDFWGVDRTPEAEARTTAIIALDLATGRERWIFQTVHHDLWDYDTPAQPALYDMPDGQGGTLPALIQATKTGNIFVLDRRTGQPLSRVEERPVPTNGQAPDQPAPTQPYSVDMPRIGAERLTERSMWGMTMFDQLWCRIAFRKLRYDGDFTPPSTTASLLWPGFYGGMNWGSVAINGRHDLLIVNDIRMGMTLQMHDRAAFDALLAKRGVGSHGSGNTMNAMAGTPYGMETRNFVSPLGVPCQEPPFGTLTAIELKTKQIVWQRPLGTTQDTGPLGIRTGLPMPVGLPTLSGSSTTASGLVFFAGTQDFYLRAFDVTNGKELWKARMPVGSQGTPMTYVSPTSGRQYVVISAGGARMSPAHGDYVIAYALPDAGKR